MATNIYLFQPHAKGQGTTNRNNTELAFGNMSATIAAIAKKYRNESRNS